MGRLKERLTRLMNRKVASGEVRGSSSKAPGSTQIHSSPELLDELSEALGSKAAAFALIDVAFSDREDEEETFEEGDSDDESEMDDDDE